MGFDICETAVERLSYQGRDLVKTEVAGGGEEGEKERKQREEAPWVNCLSVCIVAIGRNLFFSDGKENFFICPSRSRWTKNYIYLRQMNRTKHGFITLAPRPCNEISRQVLYVLDKETVNL